MRGQGLRRPGFRTLTGRTSRRAHETRWKVPKVSMSITVLKALEDKALAGHREAPSCTCRRKETSVKASASSGWSQPAREGTSAFGQTLNEGQEQVLWVGS